MSSITRTVLTVLVGTIASMAAVTTEGTGTLRGFEPQNGATPLRGLILDPVAGIPMQHPRQESKVQLEQLGLAMRMFAAESPGQQYPPLNVRVGKLSVEPRALVPEYITNTSLFVSPTHPEAPQLKEQALREPLSVIDDRSYWYLGYVLPDEDTGVVFLEAFKGAVKAGDALDNDVAIGGFGTIYRLREGVERALITDVNNPEAAREMQARIPIMIERPGLQDGGSNVLYLDGHVEFIPYPGRFPMTEEFVEALRALDSKKTRPGAKAPLSPESRR